MPVATGEPATAEQIARAPKALLHDHLDGGLRPQTILDLALEIGHALPASDADSLSPRTPARWSGTSRRSTTRSR